MNKVSYRQLLASVGEDLVEIKVHIYEMTKKGKRSFLTTQKEYWEKRGWVATYIGYETRVA